MVDFEYNDSKTHLETSKIIKSFKIINNTKFIEFYSPNSFDLLKIKKILKTKLNMCSFQENFQCIKKIGKGNFASVKFNLNRNNYFYY